MEVIGQYSKLSHQGERIQALLQMTPEGPAGPIVRTPKQVQRRLSPDQVFDLTAAYQHGATVNELARKLEISRTTVMKVRQREGLPSRRGVVIARLHEAEQLYGMRDSHGR